jgi:type I restriction enzyme S subunit
MKSNTETKHGYKKTKLGLIPEDWKLKKLSDVISLESGQHLSPDEYNNEGEGYPYFTGPTDFCNSVGEVTKWSNVANKYSENGDILITVKGSGVGSLYISELNKVAIGRQLMAIKPQNMDRGFLYNFLKQRSQVFEILASGNMIPGLSRKDILSFRVPYPPNKEQKRIADIFSVWDEAISKTEKLIQAKKRYKKGLMQRLISGKVRFPEFEGEDWVEVKLGDIAEVISSNLDKKVKKGQEEVRLCNYMDVYDNAIIDSSLTFMKSTASEREIEKYTLKKDDVIITKDSETADDIANAAVVKNLDSRILCGYHLAILRPNKEKVIGDFLAKEIMTFDYRKQFFRMANGATRYGLRISDIENAKFNIPSLKEQEMISSLINYVNKEIDILNKEKLAFQKQKNGLMQQLLTGKVRVN